MAAPPVARPLHEMRPRYPRSRDEGAIYPWISGNLRPESLQRSGTAQVLSPTP